MVEVCRWSDWREPSCPNCPGWTPVIPGCPAWSPGLVFYAKSQRREGAKSGRERKWACEFVIMQVTKCKKMIGFRSDSRMKLRMGLELNGLRTKFPGSVQSHWFCRLSPFFGFFRVFFSPFLSCKGVDFSSVRRKPGKNFSGLNSQRDALPTKEHEK
jgi:hypothetical protein